MIKKQEILNLAAQEKIDPIVIEKDYVLSWILSSIQNHIEAQPFWVFKGGLCIKKCHLPKHRFSEVIHFALTSPEHGTFRRIRKVLMEIASWISRETNIRILSDYTYIEAQHVLPNLMYIQATLVYQGPLQTKINFSKIKIHIYPHEKIALPSHIYPIHHFYSDAQTTLFINAYTYEELFAEKITTLSEQMLPKDLYDTIYLYESRHKVKNKNDLLYALQEKCTFKKIPFPTLENINHIYKQRLITDWHYTLAPQVPRGTLKPADEYLQILPKVFDWLYN